jgi:hypothetical protein
MASVNLRSGEGWLRVWLVATAIWIAAFVAFKVVLQVDAYVDRQQAREALSAHPPFASRMVSLTEQPFQTRSQRAWDSFWRNALVATGPPVAVPAIVFLALWIGRRGMAIGRWVTSGFEPNGEP